MLPYGASPASQLQSTGAIVPAVFLGVQRSSSQVLPRKSDLNFLLLVFQNVAPGDLRIPSANTYIVCLSELLWRYRRIVRHRLTL